MRQDRDDVQSSKRGRLLEANLQGGNTASVNGLISSADFSFVGQSRSRRTEH